MQPEEGSAYFSGAVIDVISQHYPMDSELW